MGANVAQCATLVNTIIREYSGVFDTISELVELYIDDHPQIIYFAISLKVRKGKDF